MKRERSPLKKGDKVKFFGFSNNGKSTVEYDEWAIVTSNWSMKEFLLETSLGNINRFQVFRVKRKKQRREFLILRCHSCTPARIFNVGEDIKFIRCANCEVIKVREVKE